ncbi:MAG: RNA-binding S4 domain-containing protein [Bacilli bacterium]|nr:RNA-binding S4 domain-containing protein [Bacilli bacterium]
MRLDLVLKQSGLIKRRTVAKELAERGRILINDRVAKPSSEVKSGDLLELRLGNRVLVVEISFVERFKREFPTYKEVLTKKVNSDA